MTWLRFLDQAAPRAVIGGVFYALLVLSLDQVVRLAQQSLRARRSHNRLASHEALWAWIVQFFALVGSIVFTFALLMQGTFAANDVGVTLIDWPVHGAWLAVLIPGTMVLIALFWAPYFSRAHRFLATKGPESERSRVLPSDARPATLLQALTDEASLTVFRAACIPLLGPYWGIWFGLGWNAALRGLRQRPTTMVPERRGFHYLAFALDWLSATLFVATGSLWACILGRVLCHAFAQIIRSWSLRRRVRWLASTGEAAFASETITVQLGEDEGQDDQRGEHDSGQDGDALEVT